MRANRVSCPPDQLVADLAARQYGVVGRRQLSAAGLSRDAVATRIRRGRLHEIHWGAYAVGHRRLSREGRWMAALLSLGDGAVLSHRSAGALWQITADSTVADEVTVSSRGGRRPRAGVRVHRHALAPSELASRRGIPVTTVARTLLDLACVLRPAALQRATGQAEALRLFDLRAVEAVLRAHRGRAGTAALARILGAEPVMTRSDLEARFLDLCADHDIPRPRVNARVGPYEVDFLWPAQRLIAETDGRRYHGSGTAYENDRYRDAQLLIAGYHVVRFTFRQVTEEPRFVARTLRSLLRARTPS